MEPERRGVPPTDAKLRVAGAGTKRRIIGYGAVFNRSSHVLNERGRTFVERIAPGAFDDALRNSDVRGLVNHSPDMLLGRVKSGTMRLTVDNVGLFYDIDAPDTQVGRDTVVSIERGDLDASSFSFTVAAGGDSWDNTQEPAVRTIRSIRDLFDTGPVCFAAYPDATAGVRSRPGSRQLSEQEWYARVHAAFQRGCIDARTVVALRQQWRQRERDRQIKQQRLRILRLRLGQKIAV